MGMAAGAVVLILIAAASVVCGIVAFSVVFGGYSPPGWMLPLMLGVAVILAPLLLCLWEIFVEWAVRDRPDEVAEFTGRKIAGRTLGREGAEAISTETAKGIGRAARSLGYGSRFGRSRARTESDRTAQLVL